VHCSCWAHFSDGSSSHCCLKVAAPCVIDCILLLYSTPYSCIYVSHALSMPSLTRRIVKHVFTQLTTLTINQPATNSRKTTINCPCFHLEEALQVTVCTAEAQRCFEWLTQVEVLDKHQSTPGASATARYAWLRVLSHGRNSNAAGKKLLKLKSKTGLKALTLLIHFCSVNSVRSDNFHRPRPL